MATIDYVGEGTTGHPARDYRREPYVVKKSVSFATAATTKGSNLVAGDYIQVLQVPANTMVIGGGVRITTATTSTVSTATFDFGNTASVDFIADGFNPQAAAGYVAVGTNGALDATRRFASADTLNLGLITAPSAGIADGVVTVYAILADIE